MVLDDGDNALGLVEVHAQSATLADRGIFTLGSQISVSSSLTVSAGDTIIQSGALVLNVGLSLSSSGALILDHPGNDFGLVDLVAEHATLVDKNDFTIGNHILIGSSLTLRARGNIMQSGSLSLGRQGLSEHPAHIILDDPNNDFGQIELNASIATVVAKTGLLWEVMFQVVDSLFLTPTVW